MRGAGPINWQRGMKYLWDYNLKNYGATGIFNYVVSNNTEVIYG